LRLPVPPEELRRRFPSLTDEDLTAWTEITRGLLADPARRGQRLAGILSAARRAEGKEAGGIAPDPEEARALRYTRALAKMQGR
jgi:hypothetical protein